MEKEYKDLLIGIANHLIIIQELVMLNGRKNAYVKNHQFEEGALVKKEEEKLIEKLPNIKKLLEKCTNEKAI